MKNLCPPVLPMSAPTTDEVVPFSESTAGYLIADAIRLLCLVRDLPENLVLEHEHIVGTLMVQAEQCSLDARREIARMQKAA